jgi:hypothetical protein
MGKKIWENISFENTLNIFQILDFMYRIIINITWGRNKCGIILHLKIDLFNNIVCRHTYRVIGNIILGIYESGTTLHLIIKLIIVKV